MRRPTRFVATAALTATAAMGIALPAALSTPAQAAAATVESVRLNGFEARLFIDINNVRRQHGLVPLTIAAGTTDVARRWTDHLAGQRFLSHNPSIVTNLQRAGSSRWHDIAENVGEGPASRPDVLFQAYMASPEHRANILDRYSRFVGIGVVQRGATAWNTIDFVDSYSTAYGRTRVPADGMTMDQKQIDTTRDVATLESPDQRFTSQRRGRVHASRVQFGQVGGNGAAYTNFSARGRGRGSIVMQDALNLTHAHGLKIQLAAHDPRGRRVPVTVALRRTYDDGVRLGTVRTGTRGGWASFKLPQRARTFRNTLVLSVPAKAIRRAGGKLRLLTFDVRVVA
jgi:uncharacterized protein YkwD